jgi:outer membrane protein
MKYIKSLIVAALILYGSAAYTAETPKVVTLNECVTIALQNNPAVKASEEDKKKASAEYRVANAQRLPFINAEIRSSQYPRVPDVSVYDTYLPYLPISQSQKDLYSIYKYQEGKKPKDFIDKLSEYYTIGVSMGVSAGISIFSEKANRMVESTRTGQKLSNVQARKVMSDVIVSVKKAYYSHMMAKDTVQLREKLLKYNEERLKVTQILYKNAQRPIYDLSKATLDLNDAQLELQKSKNYERSTKYELLRSMGIDDTEKEFNLEKKEILPEIKYSVDQLNKLGELNYPDMQIARLQTELNRIKVAVENGGHYPEVTMQVGVGYENGRFDKYIFDPSNWKVSGYVGFIARMPVYSGGMVIAKVDSAVAEYNKSIYKEKDVAMNMQLTIQNNYISLQELSKQLSTAKLMMENADKHFKLAQKMYDSGATTLLDLHDANVSRANAELNYLRTKFDYQMTIARLSSIVGLGEDSLCKK